jgi:hypothetical protein
MFGTKNKTSRASSMNFAAKGKSKASVLSSSKSKMTGFKAYLAKMTAKQIGAVLFFAIVGVGGAVYWIKHPVRHEQAATVAYEDNDIPGWWMQQYFHKSLCSEDICKAAADPDHDGLTNDQEYYYHSDPLNANTAKDSLNDGEMVAAGYDPSQPGRVKFDDVLSEENILGEGILYNTELKQMIADQEDLSKVAIPLPDQSQLNVSYTTNPEDYKAYIEKINALSEKYFPQSESANFADTIKNGTGPGVQDMIARSQELARELRATSVPIKFLSFHQYSIAFYELFSQILNPPPMDVLSDLTNHDVDAWYDKAQAFFAVQDKLTFEKQLLATQDIPDDTQQ